ncbi:hypothetical protein ACSBR1_023862 [Camellia fascicularis]
MEIEGEDGSKIKLKQGFKREMGRGLGFTRKDRTVSRRHIWFELQSNDEKQTTHNPNSKSMVCFQVIGKNPIWVYNTSMDEIRVFRRLEGGEMEVGDMFCVSAKQPLWFTLKRFQNESELKRELGNQNELLQSSCGLTSVDDLEIDSIDVSDIDPVKEFGFLVMGHEFDRYPKDMIRHAKTWEWFLEQPNEDSEDDVPDNKGNKGVRRKRKKSEGNDDDEWTGEREDDKELITKLRKVQRPKYSTRSKDCDKPTKDTRINIHSVQKKTIGANEEDEEEEDDDTLGGFIVKDDDLKEEEEEEEEEEEVDEEDEDYGEGDDEE